MNKDIDSMNERELLAELVRQGRRVEKADRIKTCVLAVLLVTLIVLALVCIPKILTPIRQISASMDQIRGSFDEVSRVFGSLDADTIGELRRLLGSFDADTVDRLKQTMESLNETSQQARVLIDQLKDSGLDKLPSSIESLSNSLSSILKIFK